MNSLNIEEESLEQQINECQEHEIELNSSDIDVEENDLEIINTKLADSENQLLLYEINIQNLKESIQLYKNQINEYRMSKAQNIVCGKDAENEIFPQTLINDEEQPTNMIDNIESLTEQVITNEQEKNLQQERKLDLNTQLIDQVVALLSDEIMKYEQELNNYDLNVKTLKNILTIASTILKDIKNQRSLIDNKIGTFQNTLEQQTQELYELQNNITDFNNQIQDLIQEKTGLCTENNYETNTLKETQIENIEEITSINDKITKLNDQIQENENSATQISFDIKKLKTVFNNEKQNYEQRIQEMNMIQNEFNAINTENLEQKNNDLNLKVEQLQEQLEDMKLNEKSLKKKIEYLESLCIEVDYLKSECLEREKISTEYNSNIQVLTDKLNKITIEFQSFKIEKENEITSTKELLENKEIEMEKKNNELNHINNELLLVRNKIYVSKLTQNEIEQLRHENSEWKSLATKIKEKSSLQYSNFQIMLGNLKSQNEKLKTNITSNLDLIKSLEEHNNNLQRELDKNVVDNLRSKIKNLEEENRALKNLGNYLQGQTTQKIYEIKKYKKRLDILKNGKIDFLKYNSQSIQLKNKLETTQESLMIAQASIKQLQKEKNELIVTSRSMKHSLERANFELYAIKTLQTDQVKKPLERSRSLHDSSGVLFGNDKPAVPDQPEDMQNITTSYEIEQNKESNQIDTECDHCKILENAEILKLKEEVETWRKKYDICKNLCGIRKQKIAQLEHENDSTE